MAKSKDELKIDPAIPEPILRRIAEEQPLANRWSDDLRSLLSPSIEARPLHLPGVLAIERRLNTEVEFFWARDRNGSNPNHDRVGELRSQGFEFASSDPTCDHEGAKCQCDVIMRNPTVVLGTNEIRNGDLLLMKVTKPIWQAIRKQQQIDSLRQTSPRQSSGKRSIMSTLNALPGIRSEAVSDATLDELVARRVYSTPDDPTSGNASKFTPKQPGK